MLEDTHLISSLAKLQPASEPPARIERLAGDASTRSYFRAHFANGNTALVMVQPEPGRQLEAPFLDVHKFLETLGLPVPQVYHHDSEHGLIVLEDLGDDLLETIVERQDGHSIKDLYTRAVDLLVTLRHVTAGLRSGCIAFSLAFDEKKLMEELAFFMTHFVRGLCKLSPPRSAELLLVEFFDRISRLLAAEPRVFAHRDYHSRNLILHRGRVVMIDFQDARMGPAQYDLASLLRDSYVTLAEDLVSELIEHYQGAVSETQPERFRYVFDVMSLQRNIKALGTFGFQVSVRGSARYISSIPRTGRYIAGNIALYPDFARYRSAVEDFISGPAQALSS